MGFSSSHQQIYHNRRLISSLSTTAPRSSTFRDRRGVRVRTSDATNANRRSPISLLSFAGIPVLRNNVIACLVRCVSYELYAVCRLSPCLFEVGKVVLSSGVAIDAIGVIGLDIPHSSRPKRTNVLRIALLSVSSVWSNFHNYRSQWSETKKTGK